MALASNEDVRLVNTVLAKLVAIVKEGYYDELISLVNNDDDFKATLIALEKLINWNYIFTTNTFNEEFLNLINDFELDALIRVFTVLDGKDDQFTFGSLTPVSSLLSRLSNNFTYNDYDELLVWVFKNRTNPFILPAKIFHSSNEAIEIKTLELFKQYSLYEQLKLKIINLSKKNIYFQNTKNYIGFKHRIIDKSFANVYIKNNLIRIHLSTLPKYTDPKKLLKQVPYKEWSALRNYIDIKSSGDLDDAMKLVEQSFASIAAIQEEKIFNLLDSPQKNYGSEASFLKKANQIANLLNELVNTKKINQVDELQIVSDFFEAVKKNSEVIILLYEGARDFNSFLNKLVNAEWLTGIKKERIKKFIKESQQRTNGLCIDYADGYKGEEE